MVIRSIEFIGSSFSVHFFSLFTRREIYLWAGHREQSESGKDQKENVRLSVLKDHFPQIDLTLELERIID